MSGGGGGGEAVQLKGTVGSFYSRLFMKVWNLDDESPLGQKDLTKVKMQAVAKTINAHVKCTSKLGWLGRLWCMGVGVHLTDDDLVEIHAVPDGGVA